MACITDECLVSHPPLLPPASHYQCLQLISFGTAGVMVGLPSLISTLNSTHSRFTIHSDVHSSYMSIYVHLTSLTIPPPMARKAAVPFDFVGCIDASTLNCRRGVTVNKVLCGPLKIQIGSRRKTMSTLLGTSRGNGVQVETG